MVLYVLTLITGLFRKSSHTNLYVLKLLTVINGGVTHTWKLQSSLPDSGILQLLYSHVYISRNSLRPQVRVVLTVVLISVSTVKKNPFSQNPVTNVFHSEQRVTMSHQIIHYKNPSGMKHQTPIVYTSLTQSTVPSTQTLFLTKVKRLLRSGSMVTISMIHGILRVLHSIPGNFYIELSK